MFEALPSFYLVPFDGSFKLSGCASSPPAKGLDKKKNEKRLKKLIQKLDDLQRKLYAQDEFSLLLIFQAMDAAGKDGTIRAVMRGINPAGCQVFSFKKPTAEELDHDFLWRTSCRLPERGRIGIFNRSYYEEVLVVRVHPEFLAGQRLPEPVDRNTIWEERFESIRDHEKHLARNGTVVLKFWLNVSKEEQRKRFLSRIEESDKNWKFSDADLKERALWDRYMESYESALRATSRSWAPWFAIPADDKPFMRMCVSEIIVETLEALQLSYPEVSRTRRHELQEYRKKLS